MTLLINLFFQQQGFFTQLGNRIQEGGPFSMSFILICFLLMLFFIVRAIIKIKAARLVFDKSIRLINEIALLAAVVGIFSQFLGLIQVFDAFEALGDISPSLLAGGLKLTLLPPIFGGFVLILGRLASFILRWIRKEQAENVVSI